MNALPFKGVTNVRNTCFKRIVLFPNQNSSTVVIKAVLPHESCPLGDIEETTHEIVNQLLTQVILGQAFSVLWVGGVVGRYHPSNPKYYRGPVLG